MQCHKKQENLAKGNTLALGARVMVTAMKNPKNESVQNQWWEYRLI